MDLFVADFKSTQNTVYRDLGNGRFLKATLALAPGPSLEHFDRVGHSLFALLIALLGGLLARYVFARHRDPSEAALSS